VEGTIDGTIEGTMEGGGYEVKTKLVDFQAKFKKCLREEYDTITTMIRSVNSESKEDGTKAVYDSHQQQMNKFYAEMGSPGSFTSHSVCLSCLDEYPDHALPCGHVLCFSCLETVGTSIATGFLLLNVCPLVQHDDESWKTPCVVSIKPKQAGARILALDGYASLTSYTSSPKLIDV
jgi:hypothetical protein